MNDSGNLALSYRSTGAARLADYIALLKPRVMSLVVFTGVAGMVVAPGSVSVATAVVALLCIAAGAGASGALNMAYDADIDALMARTRRRPIPQGLISRKNALVFGWFIAITGVASMAIFVNLAAASLLATTIAIYIGVYTLWLKRRTPQNIVVGGLAGALPPAIGWAAVTGSLSFAPLALVLIIFLWTPAHFWSLALWRASDYKCAGVPMMPVVRGKTSTRAQIFGYSLALIPSGLLPVAIGIGGPIYLAVALVMGAAMVWQSAAVLRERDDAREPNAHRLFLTSLLYVFVLFGALIIERVINIPPLAT